MKPYIAAFVFGIGLIGCTSGDRAEVRQESREAASEVRARTAEARQDASAARREYQERWQARLDKIDREMDEERAKLKDRKLTAKQRAEYNERVAELDNMKKETREKWNEVKNSTDENWEKFKDGLDKVGDKFENAWNSFITDMKS